jgi:Tol biopolymer transport system component
MGEVYRARDPRLGRDVAIKVLPAAFSADPERLHRFEQEARAAAALNHPNILAVYDIGQHDGAPYIVSELLEGETLRERLSGGALPVRKAVEYAVQIAHGLAAAHEKGITHRDLKPENVFVTSDGRVKILDFGLAKLTQAEPAGASLSALPTTPPDTVPGVVLGTIGYMAPEQVRGQTADHRSDIFAFGAILYEMLSGQRAFLGATAADTMGAILAKDRPDLPTAERHISPALIRIVDRCLEKSPAARFQTATDLAFALESVSSPSDSAAAAPVAPGRQALLHNARVAWGIAASSLLIAALAIATTLYLRPAAPAPVVTRLDVVTPPTSEAFSFALSPDGRQLAFVANGENGSQLWLRPLDQVAARPLAGTEGAIYPFWAPDGRAIGFFAGGKLKRLDLAGSVPQVLADTPQGRGGSWNSDGVIVFAPSTVSGLMRVMATGGTPVAVTRFAPGHGSHRWPQFLLDGRRVVFLVTLGRADTHGMYVVSLDGGEPTRVLAGETAAVYAPPGYLLWVSQGVLVAQRFDATRATLEGEPIPVTQALGIDDGTFRSAFSVSAMGTLAHRVGSPARRQLVWVDRTGKVLNAIGVPDDNVLANPALAPDGQRVAVSRIVDGNFDVWLMEVGRGVANRYTFDAALDATPIWSPDGSRLVFSSTRKGATGDLYEKPADGATDEQPFFVNTQDKWPHDWSRDGRFILYAVTADPKSGWDLWALPLTGERKPFPVVQTSFEEFGGQFSPDGRWIAYASNESGRSEIYVRPFPGPGGKWQVSTAGGAQPRWRRDGKELFYVAPDNRLMAVPLGFAADARAVDVGAPVALFPTRLASGAGIGSVGSFATAQYDIATDGRFLMNVAVEEATAPPITIVQNWLAGLKK